MDPANVWAMCHCLAQAVRHQAATEVPGFCQFLLVHRVQHYDFPPLFPGVLLLLLQELKVHSTSAPILHRVTEYT